VSLRSLRTIAFEGTNVLTYERVGKSFENRTGAVMADFPGPGPDRARHGAERRLQEVNDRERAVRAARSAAAAHASGVSTSVT